MSWHEDDETEEERYQRLEREPWLMTDLDAREHGLIAPEPEPCRDCGGSGLNAIDPEDGGGCPRCGGRGTEES